MRYNFFFINSFTSIVSIGLITSDVTRLRFWNGNAELRSDSGFEYFRSGWIRIPIPRSNYCRSSHCRRPSFRFSTVFLFYFSFCSWHFALMKCETWREELNGREIFRLCVFNWLCLTDLKLKGIFEWEGNIFFAWCIWMSVNIFYEIEGEISVEDFFFFFFRWSDVQMWMWLF